jgi:hypothetical protein
MIIALIVSAHAGDVKAAEVEGLILDTTKSQRCIHCAVAVHHKCT